MDWKTISIAMGFLVTMGGVFYSIVKSHTIQNNDLKHLEAKVNEIADRLTSIEEKVDDNTRGISEIKGNLDGIKE